MIILRQGRRNQLADLIGPMLGTRLPLAGRGSGYACCGAPVGWFLVRLLLGENPIGGFGQITSGGTDGDGVALAALDAFIEMGDILHPPVGVMAMADDDVGGFDEGPFQVGVALFDQATVVSAASAGADLGDEAGVAGEVLSSSEAVDGTDLSIDDDGQHPGRAGHGLDELDGGGDLDLGQNASFQLIDMVLDGVEQFELLLGTASGLEWQLIEEIQQIGSPLWGEDVASVDEGEVVLGEGGVSAVFEHSADPGECHAGARELAFVTQVTGWDPNGGQCAVVKQGSQSVGVELVGLMDMGHHFFGEVSVGEQGEAACGFNLVDDPVPVADGFQSDRSAFGKLGEEGLDGAGVVIDPHPVHDLAAWAAYSEEGKVLVRVAAELIIGVEHLAPPVH